MKFKSFSINLRCSLNRSSLTSRCIFLASFCFKWFGQLSRSKQTNLLLARVTAGRPQRYNGYKRATISCPQGWESTRHILLVLQQFTQFTKPSPSAAVPYLEARLQRAGGQAGIKELWTFGLSASTLRGDQCASMLGMMRRECW